jgi:hypothetical protein
MRVVRFEDGTPTFQVIQKESATYNFSTAHKFISTMATVADQAQVYFQNAIAASEFV